jgi:iron complex outermembrane receptor protein
LNLGVLPDNALRLRTSYGKSFRVPTFNELNWSAGGNLALRPERSLSFDAGAVSELPFDGTLALEATYFSIETRDRIIWIPLSGGFWSPQNIARVTSRGCETEIRWMGLGGMLELTVNSTWTVARKESQDFAGDPTTGKDLIYVPRQVVNATATVHLGPWSLFIGHAWTSFRYTTETNDRFLPAYSVTSAAVRVKVPAGPIMAFARLEATNLFNTSYQVIALYPMPLRQFRATIGGDL